MLTTIITKPITKPMKPKIIPCITNLKKPKKPISVCRSSSSYVLPEFVELYTQYICHPDTIHDCVMSMIIPDSSEQLSIVQNMVMISNMLDMQGLESVFMKLLITHDNATLEKLISSLAIFNEYQDIINEIIRYATKIPFTHEVTLA